MRLALPKPSKTGKPLFNAAVLLWSRRAAAVSRKCLLPACDGFDEVRHFELTNAPTLVRPGGRRIGQTICEAAPERGVSTKAFGSGRRIPIVQVSKA